MNFRAYNLPPGAVVSDIDRETLDAEAIAENEAELSDLARERYLDRILFPPDRDASLPMID